MVTIPMSSAWWDMGQRLLTCVHESLAHTDAGAPASAYMVPGAQVAWDFCHCGGQLTVHVRTSYPSDEFPAQKLRAPFTTPCAPTWTVVEFVVTILRCVPVQDNDGNPPPPEDQNAAAFTDMADRAAVWRGVTCCFDNEDPRRRTTHLLQEQLGVGHQGQCAGSELHVLVALANCESCDGAA
jgi:hypothetical protein